MELTNRQLDIIVASCHIIQAEGVHNLTTKRLAKEMKFSEPALYRHFKGKADILKSIITNAREQMSKNILPHLDINNSGLQNLQTIINQQIIFVNKNKAIPIIIFSDLMSQFNSEVTKTVDDTINMFKLMIEAMIDNGQKDKSIRSDLNKYQLASIIIGSIRFNILMWRLSDFKIDLIKEGNQLCDTITILLKPND
ncbi:MAG: TetR/AcrR family transcriptional regulator [Saprospiraceae bacterium]